jgi:hypothetical protein
MGIGPWGESTVVKNEMKQQSVYIFDLVSYHDFVVVRHSGAERSRSYRVRLWSDYSQCIYLFSIITSEQLTLLGVSLRCTHGRTSNHWERPAFQAVGFAVASQCLRASHSIALPPLKP